MPRLPLLARVLRAITLRWLLALLLLVAQQGALTHALGHAAGHAHESVAALQAQSPLYQAHSDALDQHQAPGKRIVSEQCAFDLVYRQVLGGMHADHAFHFSATEAVAHVVIVPQSRGTTADVPYDSRGPPVRS